MHDGGCSSGFLGVLQGLEVARVHRVQGVGTGETDARVHAEAGGVGHRCVEPGVRHGFLSGHEGEQGGAIESGELPIEQGERVGVDARRQQVGQAGADVGGGGPDGAASCQRGWLGVSGV